MGFVLLISVFTLSMLCCYPLVHAQQPYVGKTTTDCSSNNTQNSELGYSCNGLNRSCQAFLIFRSLPPYSTVASISTLLASEPSQLSGINSVSETAAFETDKQVIVPVNCSCSGENYQANTSHVIKQDDTYLLIANNTFQGLSTCQALQHQNGIAPSNLSIGTTLTIPLRCACPTKYQSDAGIKYLLSYLAASGDDVPTISERFGADAGRTREANGLSEESTIYPFTTLLVPLDKRPSSSQTVVPPPPPPSPPPAPLSPTSSSENKTWVYILVGVLAGIALIVVVGIIVFCVFFGRSEKKSDSVNISEGYEFEGREKPLKKQMGEESENFFESMSSIAQSLKVYSFEDLQSATDNFSPSNWIKGSVYRATINGDFAAIKKVNGDVSKEITLLTKINHSSLIRLSGVCFHDGHWYLVYEYAANGPLSDWIYCNNSDGKFLNWMQRIQIALDVGTGLNYLHSFTTPPHVHKDINSNNVLLDSDFRAKIANFALARPTEGQEGQFALTRHIVGTKGYMAPEYLENGLVSTKLDVYAFGVLTLEIVTGKEVAELNGDKNMDLSDVLNAMLQGEDGQESLRHLMDPSLQGNYPLELATFVIRLINSCLKKDPTSRPAIDETVQFLSRILTSSLNWELSNSTSGY